MLFDKQTFGFSLDLPRVVSGGKDLTRLSTPLAGVSQTDFGIYPQCQEFFLASEEIFQSPVSPPGRRD
jgi:hypothetical protein